MSSPEGLLIGKPTNPWKIGRLLGSGACGSVHELTAPSGSKSSSPAYAIKIAALPKSKAASKAGKKRKKTAEERNADLILHEYTVLQNAGSDMRGKVVPEIPFMGDPPAFGETPDKKFRFLVMEQMCAPLSEVVPILLDLHSKTKGVAKIPMGDVAIAMLNCIQSMHEKGNLFVDVKPENFMLGSSSSSKKSKKTSDVSERVRLIDFGLVEMYNDMSSSKHRENAHPDAALVGTPSYASLNVMSGHTASRRDDLEALGYVISELILMLVSSGQGISAATGKRKKKDNSTLPWSHAASDNELYKIKLQEMDKSKRSKSKFFAGLKAAGADTVMANYFAAVKGLKYSEKPDYVSLRCCLKKLIVTVESSGVTAEVKKASSVGPKKTMKPPAPRKSASRKYEESDSDGCIVADENVENRKSIGKKHKVSVGREGVARRSNRSARNAAKTREIATQTDEIETIDVDSSDDEHADTMEWEAVASDENIEPSGNDAKGKSILKLDVIEGPHLGREIYFGGDYPETVLVGRFPKSTAVKDATKFALSEDDSTSAVHAKFVISSKRNVHSVRVSDMSSSNGTFVNGSILPKGKGRQAFIGDKILLGRSLLQIRKA
eukprot:CAMPEP_0172553278 /NCGR_PEP_ID=MMETSP1067-20121228/49803_1 /TAXON_ID=265564 ORGANISM="Thalassiosira punctigera, Strain Tpunct2005C2" /NCGR_SAMPLE_ID=MMETSP1067 /ASSEMBLY_ACC=CAM_ASM_000444 /LENGTH=606 /DNA_ID=CAMNT_0013341437 /DNA_START=73 /DNA_END=1893 /DNA_ORIENTATION=-